MIKVLFIWNVRDEKKFLNEVNVEEGY